MGDKQNVWSKSYPSNKNPQKIVDDLFFNRMHLNVGVKQARPQGQELENHTIRTLKFQSIKNLD